MNATVRPPAPPCACPRGAAPCPDPAVRASPGTQVADIEAAEKEKMREKCEKIVAHGINCFVNRQVCCWHRRGPVPRRR